MYTILYYCILYLEIYICLDTKHKTPKFHRSIFLKIVIFFLVSVTFCFMIISKPQVISSYNQRDRVQDLKFLHRFLKSLPSLSILEKVSSRKRHKINIKPLFSLTFIPRYPNSEVNSSRTLIKGYATISRFFFMLIISL